MNPQKTTSPCSNVLVRRRGPELVRVPCVGESSPKSLQGIFDSVVKSMSHLLNEFFEDFALQVRLRLDSENPHSEQQQYSLEVNKDFRKKLKKKLVKIQGSPLQSRFSEKYERLSEKFVERVHGEIRKLRTQNKFLQIIVLIEAFSLANNVSSELEKIVQFGRKAFVLGKFKQIVLKASLELFEFAHADQSSHFAVQELLKLEVKEDPSNNMQKMTVDELVCFINQSSHKKKRQKKKRKKANASMVDIELEQFKKKLDENSMISQRLRPFISDDYITALKHRLGKHIRAK